MIWSSGSVQLTAIFLFSSTTPSLWYDVLTASPQDRFNFGSHVIFIRCLYKCKTPSESWYKMLGTLLLILFISFLSDEIETKKEWYSNRLSAANIPEEFFMNGINSLKDVTQLQCIHRCKRQEKCVDVLFTPETKVCRFLSKAFNDNSAYQNSQGDSIILSAANLPGT